MEPREYGIASIGALAVVAVVLGLEPVTMAASSGSADAGRKLYLESCQSCHGPTGKGDSDMAAYLTPPPADLTAKKTQGKSDAELRKIILEGRPGTAMSSYDGAFEDARLADLIAYIRSLSHEVPRHWCGAAHRLPGLEGEEMTSPGLMFEEAPIASSPRGNAGAGRRRFMNP